MTFTDTQCRAARALLNWSQEDLVAHSKITKKTIADFERGATHPRAPTLAQIAAAAFEVRRDRIPQRRRAGSADERQIALIWITLRRPRHPSMVHGVS